MVKKSRLELDESLYEQDKKVSLLQGRADNALAIILALSVIILVVLVLTSEKENWWAVVLIGLMFLVSELFALPMKNGGRLSIALLPLVMAMMISGRLGCALVTLFGLPIFYMGRGEFNYRRILYNAGQFLFSAGVASLVFFYTGGAVLEANLSNGGKLVLPWILATVIFFIMNTILVTPALAPEGERLFPFWRNHLLDKFPGYVLYSGIGFLAAIVYLRLEFAGVVLVFAPLLAVRVIYTRYGRMRDVCDDTTLYIMEAVESGGLFPEGHSVAVADMAVAIAEEMNFQEEDIHFLKQAALLHDIGKLALDHTVMDKEGELSEEEYQEIKKHPLIGSNIVSREPSFAVVAPTITHHHEMIDGSGYVDGLAGESIPIGARILAVADSFDAMQRTRSYRGPMDAHTAASEIIKAKGVQFDPEVVDAFTSVVTRRGLWDGALRDELDMPTLEKAKVPKPEAAAEQPTLEEAIEVTSEEEKEEEIAPAESVKYTRMKGDIEKDIRDWKRSDIERQKERARGDAGTRQGSFWKRKEKKDRRPRNGT